MAEDSVLKLLQKLESNFDENDMRSKGKIYLDRNLKRQQCGYVPITSFDFILNASMFVFIIFLDVINQYILL